jgi:hypothetical protein
VPILMVTARDAVRRGSRARQRRRRLPVKPFDFGELLARLRALVRRGRLPILPNRLTAGPLTLDTRSRRVQFGTRDLILTAKEYALLEYLVRRAGDVVSRADIAEHVWDDHYDPLSNVVDVYVQRLRRKIDSGGSESLIPHAARRRVSARHRRQAAVKALSLRARLTVWYALTLLAVLALFGVQVLWQQERIGLRRVDRELADLCATLSSVLHEEIGEKEPTPCPASD